MGEERRQTHSLSRVVGERIRQLRLDRGWRQSDLIAHADETVTDSMLSFIERGERAPSLETLAVLAAAFGVHPAVLLLDPSVPEDEAALALMSIPSSKAR